jgi:hypothetical protein
LQGLAKNLEQPEVKEWLALTKDTLMGDKSGKEQDEEAKRLNAILARSPNHLFSHAIYRYVLIL